MGITRADNLSRACNNRGLAGWHFSNETADKHGAWQPLHKLVFLQTSDAVRQATGSTCVGGQSPRRALERSPHAMFKLRQKAQCVWLVARWTVARVTIGLHLDGLLLRVRATAATAAATSLA